MSTQDTCCTLAPYFKVAEGKLEDFKVLCEQFMKMNRTVFIMASVLKTTSYIAEKGMSMQKLC